MMSFVERFRVYNPGYGFLKNKGERYVIENTDRLDNPFVYLLSARWFNAVNNANSESIYTASEIVSDNDLVVTPDFFFAQAIQSAERHNCLESTRFILFSDLLPDRKEQQIGTILARGTFNSFYAQRSGRIDREALFSYESKPINFVEQNLLLPMGCAQAWLPSVDHSDKVIFLDEPHKSLVAALNNEDDLRVVLFRKALDVCRGLHQAGFKIRSFSRTSDDVLRKIYQDHNYIDIVKIGDWIPFEKMVEQYSKATLFFSFFPETHGYPIYENLQLGNGVITFSEIFSPFVVRQMQNGVQLSLWFDNELCISLIKNYFERFAKSKMRDKIRDESYTRYSTETFFARFRREAEYQRLSA